MIINWNKIEQKVKMKNYKLIGESIKIKIDNKILIISTNNNYALILEEKRCPRRRLIPPELFVKINSILLTRKFQKHTIETYTIFCAKIPCIKFTYPAQNQTMYVKPNGERFAVDQDGHVHLEPSEK